MGYFLQDYLHDFLLEHDIRMSEAPTIVKNWAN